MTKAIDLSKLPSGELSSLGCAPMMGLTHRSIPMDPPCRHAAGTQSVYGVNAVRALRNDFNPLASVAAAASIVISTYATEFPDDLDGNDQPHL